MELKLKDKSTITIEKGCFDSAGDIFVSAFGVKKALVVTDTNVAPLYADRLLCNLEKAGVNATLHVVTAGEEYKTLDTVSGMYTAMARAGITRDDIIVALGGGVVGDMAGFAGATYLRGIKVMQIPTTLLAQVDSSVGGKCGVDLSEGKNLVGAFHQPERVLIDPNLLASLPKQTLCDGMAEVIKYGVLFDESLFNDCALRRYGDDLTDIIGKCVAFKRDVVEKDEHDTSLRMCLNLGHTVGHAIEKCGGYSTYSHGQAVAMGMVSASLLGEKAGITKAGTADAVRKVLTAWNLPVDMPYPVCDLIPYMLRDKKTVGSDINFIFPTKIGEFSITKMPSGELATLLGNVYGQEGK